MTERTRYTYAIARYTHDPISGEFVNVGVVAVDMSTRLPLIKFRHAYGRVKSMFPSVNRKQFLSTLNDAERALKSAAKELLRDDLLSEPVTAQQLVRKAIPLEDQGLQLGHVGSGAANDMSKRFDQLFERYVQKYEKDNKRERRSDNDVWRPVRERFQSENVADLFEPQTIIAKLDQQRFEHTWQNGILHCIQPLSFDLVDEEAIREKARTWLGKLSALDDAKSQFKAYLLVGKPSGRDLDKAFEKGMALLEKAKSQVACEIVQESDADSFVATLAQQMRQHHSTQ
jgi:hypothetical protein